MAVTSILWGEAAVQISGLDESRASDSLQLLRSILWKHSSVTVPSFLPEACVVCGRVTDSIVLVQSTVINVLFVGHACTLSTVAVVQKTPFAVYNTTRTASADCSKSIFLAVWKMVPEQAQRKCLRGVARLKNPLKYYHHLGIKYCLLMCNNFGINTLLVQVVFANNVWFPMHFINLKFCRNERHINWSNNI